MYTSIYKHVHISIYTYRYLYVTTPQSQHARVSPPQSVSTTQPKLWVERDRESAHT